MQIENGKVRINSGFSAKVPSGTAYSSFDKTVGISIEFDASGEIEQIIDQALKVEAALDTNVKLAVAAHLGLETADVNGVILPVVVATEAVAPKAASGGGGGGSRGRSNSGGGGGRNYNDPVFTVLVSGSQVQVKDNRGLKASGKFKSNAPDFKAADGNGAWWLYDNSGNPNTEAFSIAKQIDGAN